MKNIGTAASCVFGLCCLFYILKIVLSPGFEHVMTIHDHKRSVSYLLYNQGSCNRYNLRQIPPTFVVYEVPGDYSRTPKLPCGGVKGNQLFQDTPRKFTTLFYSSGSFAQSRDPSIEIKQDDFIVFSRGDYFYNLFDLNTRRVLLDQYDLKRSDTGADRKQSIAEFLDTQ